MTKSLRLTRTSYAVSLAAYAAACILLTVFAENLRLLPYMKSVNSGLSAFFVMASAGRLVDAGFRFWISFICIATFMFVLPFMLFFSYGILVGLPKIKAEADALVFNVAVIGGFSLLVIVAGFCFLFPSAAPKAPLQDPLLDWTPKGHVPPTERQEPRF